MSNPWAKHSSNFYLHGNQLTSHLNSNQSLNKKAYLNPQVVNYEFIKRALSKDCLQGGSKIHVNPNFKGSGLGSLSNGNYAHIVNPINPQDVLLPNPGTSTLSQENGNSAIVNERNVNCGMTAPMQSRFKKVNSGNVKNKSTYSWCKNTDNSLNSDTFDRRVPPVNNIKSILEKPNVFNYNHLAYISPKRTRQILNESCPSEKNQSVYKTKMKIINKSKTNLLTSISPKTKLCFKDRLDSPVKKQLNLSKFVLNKSKKSSVSTVAKAVKNKYTYLNNLEQFNKSKYKIDKRNQLPELVKRKLNTKKIKDIRKLFPNFFYSRFKPSPYNIYNPDTHKTVSRSIHMWRKNQDFDKVTQKIMSNKFSNKRVVKIGGILYKSTANKLTLASKKVDSKKTVNDNASKGKRNYIVYVRGEKFILENNGKALRRSENVTSDKTLLLTPKRIDIGGVTYIQKSQNVLIRTNVHKARYLVNKAKNKSIALLTNLHKRSSLPCMIYHKFGRCIRHNEGLCMYKHDPQNIAVCKKFLKSNCNDKDCLLSHQVIQEKMATCHFFLNGLCVREKCPFLHVKLNKNAAICENFLQGFCKLGKECSKQHLHQCPKFDKTGSCDLGPKCPYPHKMVKKMKKLCENLSEPKGENEAVQYYVHSVVQKKQKKVKRSIMKEKESVSSKVQKKGAKRKALSQNSDNSDQSSSTIKCFPKRVKLDKLPCFIPLNSES